MGSQAPPEFPYVGKITGDVFQRIILPNLGRPDPSVIVPPRNGVDAGTIRVAPGTVLTVTTDPFFIVPAYGWRRAAWFAVHILASDAATTGIAPRYLSVDLNLPLAMTVEEFTQMWEAVHRECDRLGIAVVAGHTARYHGTDYPMVGGATMMGLGPEEALVTPSLARPGDAVLVTKGAAIEASALCAVSFPRRTARALGSATAEAGDALFDSMTVVEDCLTAVRAGTGDRGVTSMHDATEGGVLGGLVEVAVASGLGLRAERERIPIRPEVEEICREFGMDPWSAISEGTLILTCRPEKAATILDLWREAGIEAAAVGELTPAGSPPVLTAGGVDHPLVHPRVDPFWEAFARAMARGDG
jgi:hydrogenase maturation factor